ncbi:MAG TPA: serine hydrolase domain-containing protein [Myxococcota bacterium]|nr:serine hydrolase domain-containing protein [Myxococcota bacterium]
MSRRARWVWGLAATAAIAAAVGASMWRRHGDEQARVEAARDAAELAAIERSVEKLVADARESAGLPGISAAFALPDGRIGTAVAGYADRDREVRMTPDTRFLAGSVGKSFHAALAVALARDGAIDLDAPISRWIGREKWFAHLPNARDLTLRHLLQHRSGLIDHLYTFEFLARELKLRMFEKDGALIPPEQLIEPALDREPKFRAGTGFGYGDTNYVLAGIVIQRATGRSPFDQIEERFLGRLGLSGIVPARSRRIPGLAVGYQLPVNPFLLPPKMLDGGGALPVHPMLESTAGGFAATPRDLVRWAKALFEGPALPADAATEMIRNPVATGDGRCYGLGLYCYATPFGRAWGHSGWFPGYRSGMLYFPRTRIAVALQANRDYALNSDALLIEIARRVMDGSRR